MKKITFVQKANQASYDPVSTFFSSKSKPNSIINNNKQSQNTSKASSSIIKPPLNNNKKQPLPVFTQKQVNNNTLIKTSNKLSNQQYQRLKQQTIYELREKQKQLLSQGNKNKQQKKPNTITKKKQNKFQTRPQMVFDVPTTYNQGNDNNNESEQKVLSNNNGQQPMSKPVPVLVKNTTNKQQAIIVSSKEVNNNNNNKVSNTKKQPSTTLNPPALNNKPPNKVTDQHSTKAIFGKPQLQQKKQSVVVTKIINSKSSVKKQQSFQSNKHLQAQIIEQHKFTELYQQKIEQLQLKIQALVKAQQKYNKLYKQHKQCKQRNINYNKLQQQLTQTKQQIKKLLSPQSTTSIPYNTKRQYLLTNKINQLKRTNRELVLRIKNYKGGDVGSMAMMGNKQQIAREIEIQWDGENERIGKQMDVEMESGLGRMINLMYGYLESKAYGSNNNKILNNKKQQPQSQLQLTPQTQYKFLLQLSALAQKLSLTYLQHYDINPIPISNQSAIQYYAQIQKQRENILQNYFNKQLNNKVIPIEEINFAVTENNLLIVNQIGYNDVQMDRISNSIKQVISNNNIKKDSNNNRPTTCHSNNGNKTKNNFYNNNNKTQSQTKQLLSTKAIQLTKIFHQRSRLTTGFYIQSISMFTFMKQMLQKKVLRVQSQLVSLYGRLKQMKEIYQLGGSIAKQSLFMYLQSNLENLLLTVPNMRLQIKQMKSSYNQISSRLLRKQNIIIGNQ